MIIRAYVIREGSLDEVKAGSEAAPRGGWSVDAVRQHAAGTIGNGVQAVVDFAAATFGVYLAILEDAPAGQIHDFVIGLGLGPTGMDTEVTIAGAVTWGYSFVPEPALPGSAQLLAANAAIQAERSAEDRANALRQLGQDLGAWARGQGLRPHAADDILTQGEAWYADAGSVSSGMAAMFADAQAKGLIP